MHLTQSRRLVLVPVVVLCGAFGAPLPHAPHPFLAPLMAQEPATDPLAGSTDWEIDFLLNYYDQDGENSPVTGGIGTEEMDVISPVVVLHWNKGDDWQFQAQVGVDSITSASTDNIDLGEAEVSGASRLDNRAFTTLIASRVLQKQEVGFTFGFSNEYDYQSIQAGLNWSRSFRQQNTTLSAGLRLYEDTVELYGIDGIQNGEDDRSTTDLTLGFTQLFGPRTMFSAELFVSDQSGLLSTPFHEVILTGGERIPERLPESRTRTALGLRLHHSFSSRFAARFYYRFYDDDWNVQANTLEIEPHFKVSGKRDLWLYPILRYHSQESSDYFGLPGGFDGSEPFLTADRELSEFTSDKFGVGMLLDFRTNDGGRKRRLNWVESRLTSYSRDDGLDALSFSLGVGLRF